MAGRCQAARNEFELLRAVGDAAGVLAAVADHAAAEVVSPGWRGSALQHAAAEHSEHDHPVRTLIRAHRDWYSDQLTVLFQQAGDALPGEAAEDLILAIEGLCAGAYAGDPAVAVAAFRRACAVILHR
jgi:hypothetical protein